MFGSLGRALAQQSSPAQESLEEVVVTGFRESLSVALDEKRAAIGSIDAIVAEDIADFPDLNLAESIQRVPGVSIARDGGEGRQITVRGLGPQFTRVRINGMEAMSANGGTDAAGGTNRDRSFDFNTFASELFNSVTVRKTSAAEIEEGSLGATVDLRSARPFDYDGFTVVTSVQGSYNDISEDVDPRGALLISNTFADGKFGALLSAAYTERKLLDEGASTVRWQDRGTRRHARPDAEFGPLDPTMPATAPTLAQLKPRSVRASRATTSTSTSRSGSASPARCSGRSRTPPRSPSTRCLRNSMRSAARSSSKRRCSARPARPASRAVQSARCGHRFHQHARVRRVQRRRHPLRGALRRAADGVHAHHAGRQPRASPRSCALHALVGYSRGRARQSRSRPRCCSTRNDVDGYSYDYRGNSRLPVITYGNVDVTNPATWTLSQIRLRPQSSENNSRPHRSSSNGMSRMQSR